jgi:hypothetical protein
LRTRCATASTRASAAAAACAAPALADPAARAPSERALEERDRLPLDFVPLDFLLLDFVLLDFVPPDRLALEREDFLAPDELPELEPLLLAWGMPSSLCNGPAHATCRRLYSPALASCVHARVPVCF